MRIPRPTLRRSLFPLCTVLLGAHATAHGGMAKVFASDANTGRRFGGAGLALDEGRLVVGSTGPGNVAAYVFELGSGGWSEVQKLERAWPGAYDAFGASLAIDGERIAVGGPGLHNGAVAGFVYVFEETASGWAETVRLEPPQGEVADRFGFSVALDGDVLVVGAPYDDRFGADAGAAFVYRFQAGGVTLDEILAPPVPGAIRFGTSVDVEGGRILVGAPWDVKGSAHFFRRAAGAWNLEQSVTLAPGHGQDWDWLGYTVALDGDTAAIGVPNHGCYSACEPQHLDDQAGAVLVFRHGPEGWSQERELIGREIHYDRWMGVSLALDAQLVVAGAPNHSASFAFRLWVPPSSNANQGSTLRAGENTYASDRYGAAVAADEQWIAIGVPEDAERAHEAGAVYLYRRLQDDPPFCCVQIGESICSPARRHNAFQSGQIQVDGSEDAVDDCLFLHAGSLPHQAHGFFLMGSGRAILEYPGQISPLCIGGTRGILRLSEQPLQTGGDEVFNQTVGTRDIPGLATGIVPGSTWGFQAWYRKNAKMGFTDAVRVTFR